MVIGVLTLDLFISDSHSLKSKRFVLKSLKDRLRRKFNISISEEPNDLWQRVSLFTACISTDTRHLNSVLENVKKMVEKETMLEILDYSVEIL